MNDNLQNIKSNIWDKIIVGVSIAVPLLVVILFNIQPLDAELPFDVHLLPMFHAIINATVTVLLLLSMYFIKKKNIKAHKTCNITALVLAWINLFWYNVIYTPLKRIN